MSKVTIFPDPGDKYRIVTSSSMPISTYPGLAVYQTDTGRYLIHDGSNWNTVAGDERESRLLYMGKPGICIESILYTPVWRYQTPSGGTTVITNITLSSTLGAQGTTIIAGAGDTSSIDLFLYNYEIPLNGTVSMDMYLPLDALEGIVAGITLAAPSDFTSGEVSMSISGVEY